MTWQYAAVFPVPPMGFPTIHRQARNDRGRGGLDQGDIGLALSAIMIAGVIDSFAVRRIEREMNQ